MRRAGRDKRLHRFAYRPQAVVGIERQLYGAHDCGEIATNGRTVIVQHSAFVLEGFDGKAAREIPDSSVFGHDAQRQLLTDAIDDEGWIGFLDGLGLAIGFFDLIVAAIKVGRFLRPHTPDDLAGLA